MTNQVTPTVAVVCGTLCLLIGGWLFGWGIRLFIRKRRAEAGARVPGTVVEHKVTIDFDNVAMYSPVIEFKTTTGQTLRVQSHRATSHFLAEPVGSHVLIHYDPLRPAEADIVGAGLVGVVILCILGAGFCAFGVLALVAGFALPH